MHNIVKVNRRKTSIISIVVWYKNYFIFWIFIFLYLRGISGIQQKEFNITRKHIKTILIKQFFQSNLNLQVKNQASYGIQEHYADRWVGEWVSEWVSEYTLYKSKRPFHLKNVFNGFRATARPLRVTILQLVVNYIPLVHV